MCNCLTKEANKETDDCVITQTMTNYYPTSEYSILSLYWACFKNSYL